MFLYMEIQSGRFRIDIEDIIWTLQFMIGHLVTAQIWTVRTICSGQKSSYGPSVNLFLEESPYMDRQSVHFWKKLHVYEPSVRICFWKTVQKWTSQSIFKSSLLSRTLRDQNTLGTWSWKNKHYNLGNQVNPRNFLNMAPQAKPLCSRDLYRNSV